MEMDTSEAHSRKNRGLRESHPGAVSTGDSPKARLAQNPKNSAEKPGNPFSHSGLGIFVVWWRDTTQGLLPLPPGVVWTSLLGQGWDGTSQEPPGLPWEEKGKWAGGRLGFGCVTLCPSKLFHGWDKMSLDTTPARHRGTRSHQRAVVVDTGPWSGHPCPGTLCLDTPQPLHGLLFPCGIWPSGAGPGGMG